MPPPSPNLPRARGPLTPGEPWAGAARRLSIPGLCIALLALLGPQARGDEPARERTSFDAGWRFTKGDPSSAGDTLGYARIKDWVLATGTDFLSADRAKPARPEGELGAAVAYTQTSFDDSAWRPLTLPHDWGVESDFIQADSGETGKLPWWGVGWYRKHFASPESDRGRRVFLDVDGAMAYATVWLNGHFMGGWPYGYASWRLDLTPWLRPGEENVLSIRLDNPPDSSRWYPGGGIYRNVWLVKTSPVHVAQWGTSISTPSISPDAATVYVETTVENDGPDAAAVRVATRVYDLGADGHPLRAPACSVDASAPVPVAPGRQALVAQTLSVPHPVLWTLASPHRYVAVTVVTRDGITVDTYETPFGVRTVAFTADKGLLLNGEHVPIQGVCLHHDLGALGSAVNYRALERRLEILRDMGCNAIRTSHNPPAPELLDLCDRMGIVVMDEAFDCWYTAKRPNDYHLLFADWHERDLRALVRRDRNHPCVILWSIGNEIPEQEEPEGWKIAKHLSAIVHEEDPTRPTVSACNKVDSGYNGFETALGVFGYNYKPTQYLPFRQANPGIPILGSETSSAVSSRGEYYFPVTDDQAGGRVDFQVSSYDLYAPPWAKPPDVEFRGLDGAPFAAGEFVWTGFDYIGEPTPFGAAPVPVNLKFTDPARQALADRELAQTSHVELPSRSSYFGIIDLAGFKKDRFYIYQARWRPDLPMAHILPHWTWPERVGQVTPVHVYTSGDEAELFLNGQSLGRKKRGPLEYRLRWDDVVYQPGELRVVAYRGGKTWAEDVVRTTGAASRLVLAADRTVVASDGQDLSFVTVSVVDAAGMTVPRAKNLLKFSVEGPGDIVATDNGDATDHRSFQSPARAAYNGLALVVLRTRPHEPGQMTLTATSEGLAAGTVVVRSGE